VTIPLPEIDQIKIDAAGNNVVWSTLDGAVLWSSLRADSPTVVVHDPHLGGAADMALSSSGHFLAVAYKDRLLVFDLTRKLADHPIVSKSFAAARALRSLGFNRKETLLAAGLEDGSILLWSMPDVRLVAQQRVHDNPAGNVTFAGDGKFLFSNAVVGDGKETALTATPVPSLTPSVSLIAGASGWALSMIATHDEWIAAVGYDGRIRYWDSKRLQPMGTSVVFETPISAAAIAPDGKQLFVADEAGWIRALPVGGANWLAMACAIVGRSLSREEWTQYLPGEPYAPVCVQAKAE
jgi:WD40 repeat protein